MAGTKGVKTSYKRYSIFKDNNEDILCEPYIVKQDDWLYKIFRKKGEISEKDFPHFLFIFKNLNPQISNIDAIEPGEKILIPLKKVKKGEFKQTASGSIDVPVVEFSSLSDDLDLAPFLKKHKIKKGESLSKLLEKNFLQKSGSISKEGIKALKLANPGIKDMDLIFEGSNIYLPETAILSQPWFQSLISGNGMKVMPQPEQTKEYKDESILEIITEPPKKKLPQYQLKDYQLTQLKKYAALIDGVLLKSGKFYFPGQNGQDTSLDLSSTPVIETKDGQKILILSEKTFDEQLLKNVKSFWQNLRTQHIAEAIEQSRKLKAKSEPEKMEKKPGPWKNIKTINFKKILQILIPKTGNDYIEDSKIMFLINNIEIEASFGRIARPEGKDILINFGNIYGDALNIIEKKGFQIVSIEKKETRESFITRILEIIGFSIWKDPSFFTREKVKIIPGIYAMKEKKKLFIAKTKFKPETTRFLEKENVDLIIVE
ncbi:MAG: LysM peptidoglycan-binding domain-containing protein [Desulfobacteraceae bacterium]|nr:LysM peptidoglycan-binding domain-containing protein [Desulfobacteraceae bacterium]